MSATNYPDFRNEIYRNLTGYTPGEQPETNDWIKLNTNENPYPPSEQVLKIIQSISQNPSILRKYPNPQSEPLKSSLAIKYNLQKENFLITNGSDEALSLLCRVFLEQGKTAIAPEITYSLYQSLVLFTGADFLFAPMKNYETLNISLENLAESEANVVFLSNPNAQTGEFITPEILLEYVHKSNKLWIIDEAYNDFVTHDSPSFVNHLKDNPNVIIVRTFSKSHSLAGMRIGYAFSCNPYIMEGLNTAKDSYNEDAVAILSGKAALNDTEYLNKTTSLIQSERKRIVEEFQERNFLTLPSQANFILIQPPEPFKAAEILNKLKEFKILVRHFNTNLLSKYLRISIGTPEENNKLMDSLDIIMGK